MTIFRIDTDTLVASAKNASTKSLLKDLGTRIRGLEPRMKAAIAKAKKLHDAVSAALKSPDANTLRLLGKGCAAEVVVFGGFKGELDAMEQLLARIEKDEAFVTERLAELLPLTKGLSNEKIDCAAWAGQLEADRNRAEEAGLDVGKADADLAKEIDALEKKVENYRAGVKGNLVELGKPAARALAAAKAGERQGYRDELASLTGAAETCKRGAAYMSKDCTNAAAAFRKKFGTRVDSLPVLKDLAAVRAEADKAPADIDRLLDKVKAAEPKGVDARRAAKALLLEKYEAELAKILNGPAAGHEKGLEALAKKAGKPSSGRVMLAVLVKARVL